jgi:peptide/nickel transport system ATP-binding protein
MSDRETLLEVKNLSVGVAQRNGVRPVLHDISFELKAKSVLGVIGETGAGKTVLSRALVGWLSTPLVATSGKVKFRGADVLTMPRNATRRVRGRQIAYIGANPTTALDPTIPVGHQIVEKLRAIEPGIAMAEAKERAISLLAAVRIPSPESRFHEYPSQFSGGMMQRALIVDALVGRPALLVADNVTQPLDVTIAAQILRLLRDLRASFGTTIVFVSSSLPMVNEIADEIVVLNKGTLVDRQTPLELINAPRHPYTQALVSNTPRIWAEQQGRPSVVAVPSTGTARPPILSVNGVSRTYKVHKRGSLFGENGVAAVRNVTFDVKAGENFGIIGESGCGKSTLSRLLTRLEAPDSGAIVFEGKDLAGASGDALLHVRQALQLVLQDPYTSMPPRMTIGRIIEEALLVHRLGGVASQRRERVLAMMAEVGLPKEFHDQLPLILSAGQRQRVNIARAMILEPRLLILDETLSALDQSEQLKLLDLFERLQRQHGLTYIFISHDLAMVRRVCTRLAVMYLGEVVELATNQTLFYHPGHPYTKALLSAVPTVEERPYRSEDCLLEGEPPSPINLPVGCSFASRCPHMMTRCGTQNPVLTSRGKGDFAACFLNEVVGGYENGYFATTGTERRSAPPDQDSINER